MINPYEPVKGSDLNALREFLGLNVADFIWLFGLSMPAWSALQANADQPVRDASVAILARWLDRHPEDCPNASARVEQLHAHLQQRPNREATKKVLGIALGREMSAGYRWLTGQSSYPPIIQRLNYILTRRYAGKEEQNLLSVDQAVDILSEVAKQGKAPSGEPLVARFRAKLEEAATASPGFARPLSVVLAHLKKEVRRLRGTRRITPALLSELRDNIAGLLPRDPEHVIELERVITKLRARENDLLDMKAYDKLVQELREQVKRKELEDPWDEIMELADVEARARGIPDIFLSGTWHPKEAKKRGRGRQRK